MAKTGAKFFIVSFLFLSLLVGCGSGLCPLGSQYATTCVTRSGSNALMGLLDTSFGSNGYTLTAYAGINAWISAMDVRSDGKILVTGGYNSAFTGRHIASRFFADGTLDTSFATAGRLIQNFTGDDDSSHLAMLSDNSFILGGGFGGFDFAIAKYSEGGVIDTSFGAAGRRTTNIGGTDRDFSSLVQSDGKIVLGGGGEVVGNSNFALARYTTTGALDTSFGASGTTTTDFAGLQDNGGFIAAQSDGKIVMVGTASVFSDFGVTRYSVDGILDTSFGVGGRRTIDFAGTTEGGAAIQVLSDDSVLAVGYAQIGNPLCAIGKLTPSGNLDTSFGTGGLATFQFGGTQTYCNAVTVESNGKIILAGYNDASGSDDVLIFRLLSNGTLDTSFGTNGVTLLDIGAQSQIAYALKLLPDGKLLVGGYSSLAGIRSMLLIKLK